MHEVYRVIEPYQAAYAVSLRAGIGERLVFERKKSEWEGWLWCTDAAGRSGWVPESWVRPEGGYCVLQQDYTGDELSVERGETLAAQLIESGWVWASKESGESGWVPMKHLAPVGRADNPYRLSDADQAAMLRKLMLYWDGQWFLKTVEVFGLEEAVALNARVRASFGRIEMRLMLKAVGKSQAHDLGDALHLLETYAQTFMANRLRAEFSALGSDRAEVIVRRCAAYEGAKHAGLNRTDQACVACEGLWEAWMGVLLPESQVEVEYPQRQGMGDPICRFVLHITAQDETA